ncbi:hypothetical protein ASPVEDRAFT_192125 [Aspergillus versicolor CBS 583.65]|uniref:Uncharacterized protein n=1 Tax=Aspergillus versicolor CBS 583.65 TaxID=1036611 RepID=A0A1L9PJX2_ASPVE|nr:uncharacterized protein ASPVEDRAFT_192125 [Aspergillus versicolor CBS 583.65]OJJ01824.1 hypothetical protein ASPVEDRAFT_192125 [Aspergillus versicolor CBS 583.65]
MAKRKRHGTNPESAQRKRPRNSSTKSNGDSHEKPSKQLEDDTPCSGTCNKRSPSMYPNEMYTVAWVCALSIELAAAKGMLDETHGQPQSQPNGDPNTYTLGRIHEFNVVIACLPADGYGTCSAANLVGTMWTTFPNLKIGLFVEIGAAIPWFSGDSIRDIRLGDVVVGTRIVDYEMRKRYDGGMVKNTGHPEKPSKILRSAIQALKADHQTKSSKITQYIDGMTQRYAERGAFTYPLGIPDRLCEACLSGGKCAGGGKATKPQSRPDRPDKHSRIHYGVIASGNTLCRDRDFREEMQKKFDAICFDMEAAGVMNNFQGLVVRGISDYADCHKNDDWHSYAAASAAGYAKLLLSYVPLNVKHAGSLGYGTTRAPEHGVQEMKVLDWISKETFESRHVDHLNRLQPDTGDWFLRSRQFKRFVGGIVTRLFCPGMPGAGKTMISTLAIDFLRREYQQDPMVAVCFLYFDYRIKYDNVTELLAIILRQLAAQKLPLAEPVRLLFEKYGIRDSKPPLKEHILTLQAVLLQWKTVFLVVDAIDECPSSNSTRQAFLEDLHAIQANSKLRIMITSRPNPDIVGVMKYGGARFLEIRARDEDVKAYIKGRLRKSDGLAGQNSKLQRRIKRQITNAADGMFLLAQLYIDRLSHLRVPRMIEDALTELPQGTNVYSDAFDQAMHRIESQVTENKELAKKALSWITNATRPLSKKELQHALTLRPTDIVFLKSGMPQMDHILSVCIGLVVLDKESGTVRLVHYTAQQYFEDKSGQWFEDAKVTIAKTCLQYLSLDDFRGQPGIDEIKSHYDRRRYHLYNYSVKNLAYHLRGTLPQLGRELMQFLTHDKLTDTFANELFYSNSDRLYTSPCHIAAALDLDGTISELLKDGHNANAPDRNSRSLIYWAVEKGHFDVVKALLDSGASANSKGPLGETLLAIPAEDGRIDLVRLLLSRGADPTLCDFHNRTPIHYAVSRGHYAITKLLLQESVAADLPQQASLLAGAAEVRGGRCLDLLIEQGCNVNHVDSDGNTPLRSAVESKSVTAVKRLLQKGASADLVDEETLESASKEMVKQLKAEV